ncbi:hypothetical protein B0H14DRAFT_2867494 [Mycena olivaceomarginata]|nr:hypothetical protein B0H14DRAFT_2867494 [Mycena olivaceomarginata]
MEPPAGDLKGTHASTKQNIEKPETPNTGRNALKFALKTLSSISSNIPFGSVLSGVIDPLLDIADRIELTSDNTQGFVELAARIELLSPLVSKIARDKPEQCQPIVEALQASKNSTQFFNSKDNASSLAKHNNHLAQMIADATLVEVHEVLRWLQYIESRIGANSEKAEDTRPEFVGGTGGKGGYGGHTGGEGGLGEAAQLAIENVGLFRRIQGGIGGEGGSGNVKGGPGGTGQGPRISHPLLAIDGNEYTLGGNLQKLLQDQGFETVGGLLEANDTAFENAGFKFGHIAELKRALNDFVSKNGSAK